VSFATFIPPEANDGIGVAFTDRWGGVSLPPYDTFDLGRHEEDQSVFTSNIEILRRLVGCHVVAVCSQVHGSHVEEVDSSFCLETPPVADGLVTRNELVALTIRVADCVPVLLADPTARVIGAAHAGRVGLLGGVIQATVAAMRASGACEIRAWMGPHICVGCYEVSPEMAHDAWEALPATQGISKTGTTAIDLGAGTQAILDHEGVSSTRCDRCTSCQLEFFSHRSDRGKTGRQAGVIWLSAC